MILGKFWSRFDLQQRRNRKFLGDDQGCLSEQTVLVPKIYKRNAVYIITVALQYIGRVYGLYTLEEQQTRTKCSKYDNPVCGFLNNHYGRIQCEMCNFYNRNLIFTYCSFKRFETNRSTIQTSKPKRQRWCGGGGLCPIIAIQM